MRGYRFTENEEVAHILNLRQKLIITKLLWSEREKFEGSNPEVKKVKTRNFDGCMCQWWEGDKLQEQRFHAETLVPWWVAVKGEAEAKKWLEQMKNEKYVIKSKSKSSAE